RGRAGWGRGWWIGPGWQVQAVRENGAGIASPATAARPWAALAVIAARLAVRPVSCLPSADFASSRRTGDGRDLLTGATAAASARIVPRAHRTQSWSMSAPQTGLYW